MEWRKLKNIILLMLAALNLALAILVLGPKLSAYSRQYQGERAAVAFLEGKGVDLEPALIPDNEGFPPRTARRDLEEEAALAESLLGADVQQEARGGEVYRYSSPKGVLQFHSDGTFWAELARGAFPLEGDSERAALSVLEQVGFTGEIIQEGNRALTVRQFWEGASLFDQRATVLWDNTGVLQISAGRRLYGTPVRDPSRESIDPATALIDFYNGLNRLGDVCSRVEDITPGYRAAASLDQGMTLTPVWRVTTDTGVYQLDLVSGGLDRVA